MEKKEKIRRQRDEETKDKGTKKWSTDGRDGREDERGGERKRRKRRGKKTRRWKINKGAEGKMKGKEKRKCRSD